MIDMLDHWFTWWRNYREILSPEEQREARFWQNYYPSRN